MNFIRVHFCVHILFFSYKPVQLTHIVAPLRERFENLFRATFSLKQNAQFLASIQVWLLCLACIYVLRNAICLLIRLVLQRNSGKSFSN